MCASTSARVTIRYAPAKIKKAMKGVTNYLAKLLLHEATQIQDALYRDRASQLEEPL